MFFDFMKNNNSSNSKNLIIPSFISNTPKDKKKITQKKYLKIFFRVIKVLVYLFFFVMGLYGCFQSYSEWWTISSPTPGNGLEIGFSPFLGIDDPRFVLTYSGTGSYFPLSDFTMAYGPFYGLFVWPFAQILLNFMWATRDWPVGINALVGIFIVLLLIRIITIAVSARSMIHSERMTEVQGKVAEINAKYKDAKDQQSRQKKQSEIQEIYRKHNIKAFAPFEQIFVTLPIFLIIYRVVTVLRPLKFIVIFNAWNMTMTPMNEIFNHFTTTGWPYIFFLMLVIPTQFLSQWVPRNLAKKRSRGAVTIGDKNNKAMKRTKQINLVMTIVLAVVSFVSAAGIGTYWFFNALFTIAQSYILHKLILRNREKNTTIESKLSKLGIS